MGGNLRRLLNESIGRPATSAAMPGSAASGSGTSG
jgi:hypothetical protein